MRQTLLHYLYLYDVIDRPKAEKHINLNLLVDKSASVTTISQNQTIRTIDYQKKPLYHNMPIIL